MGRRIGGFPCLTGRKGGGRAVLARLVVGGRRERTVHLACVVSDSIVVL